MNRKKISQLGISSFVVLLLVLVGLFVKGPYYLHIFIMILMNVVLASSLRLINLSGQLSLGHGGMVTLGAYTAALLVMKLGISSWLGLLVGAILAAGVSCLIGFPFTRLKGIYFTMVSIFFVQIIVLTVQQWRSLTGGASGLYNIPRPDGFLGIELDLFTFFVQDGFPMTLQKFSHSLSVKTAMAHHLSSPLQR